MGVKHIISALMLQCVLIANQVSMGTGSVVGVVFAKKTDLPSIFFLYLDIEKNYYLYAFVGI